MVINGFGECASSEAMHHVMIYVTRIPPCVPPVYPSVFPCVCSFDRLPWTSNPMSFYVSLSMPLGTPLYINSYFGKLCSYSETSFSTMVSDTLQSLHI